MRIARRHRHVRGERAPEGIAQPGPPPAERQVKRTRDRGPRPLRWMFAALLVVAAAAIWYFNFNPFRPRVLRVRLYTDLSFRQGRDWQRLVRSRLEEVTRIYRDAAGIRWEILSMDSPDPGAATLPSLEQRRRNLSDTSKGTEDLALSLTTSNDPNQRAAVIPFSHAAVIADFRSDSEEVSTLRLAHELGHLFGAEHEYGTLMADPPANGRFSPRAAKLLSALKRYDFGGGVEPLQTFWGVRAVAALKEQGEGLLPSPESHAHRVLARSLLSDGHVAAGIEQLRKALDLNPKSTDVRLELASGLVQDSHREEAITLLREGVSNQPRDVQLRAGLAVVLNRIGHPILALEEINQAIHIDPDDAELHSVRAAFLVSEPGFIDQALAGFETALRLNPGLDTARERLEAARNAKAKIIEEAQPSREHVRQNPKDAEAHYNLGVLELRAGRLDEAQSEFEKAVALDSGLGQAHINLALLCFARKDFAGASKELTQAKQAGAEPSTELEKAIERKVVP